MITSYNFTFKHFLIAFVFGIIQVLSQCIFHHVALSITTFFRYLPGGNDLTSADLRVDLDKLFGTFAKNSKKLASHGSSQVNESFNHTVASKAPKSKHYSASESLPQRVAAAVCQKNIGAGYVSDVCKSADLSPGVHTQAHGKRLGAQRSQSKERRESLEYKKRRLDAKGTRSSQSQSAEIREGGLYYKDCQIALTGAVVSPSE